MKKISKTAMKTGLVVSLAGCLAAGSMMGASAFFTDRAVTSKSTRVGTFNMVLTDFSDLDGTYTTWSGNTETRVVPKNGKQDGLISKDNATDASAPSTGIINPGDVGLLQFAIRNDQEKSMDTAIVVKVHSSVAFDSADAAVYSVEGLGTPTLADGGNTLEYALLPLDTINGSAETETGGEPYDADIYYAYNVPFLIDAADKYQDASFSVTVEAYAKQHRNSSASDWASIGSYEVSGSGAQTDHDA